MIRSYRNRETQRVAERERVKKFRQIERAALRKLRMIEAAGRLEDLASPPGNKLHALKGDRKGQHSISINDQWRVCFEWRAGDAYNVEITDYH